MKEHKPAVTETVDSFIAAIPAGERRMILVYRRQHGGREFVRWRYWHKHRTHGNWYPDGHKNRSFVVPLEQAEGLAGAIMSAGKGERATPMPDWMARVEARRDRRVALLKDLNAPPDVLAKEQRRRLRASG